MIAGIPVSGPEPVADLLEGECAAAARQFLRRAVVRRRRRLSRRRRRVDDVVRPGGLLVLLRSNEADADRAQRQREHDELAHGHLLRRESALLPTLKGSAYSLPP